MKYMHCISLLFLLFIPVQGGWGQEVSDYSKLTPEDYISLTLPPLDLLFEKAKNGPVYKLAEVKEQIERKVLAKEKKAFLGFFSLRGSYQYGMFGNETTYTDVSQPIINNYSTAAQNSYTIGAGFNIPLDNLFDLRGRIKRQKLNIQSAQLEREIKYEEIKREIIQLYATVASQLNVLKIRAEALELTTLQYNIAEKDFANNNITAATLSVEKQRQSSAMEAYEDTKLQLTKSLMILEVITHVSLIRR